MYVMKLSWKKSIATAVTALVLASPLAPVPAKAEAAGLLEGVIAGVAMGSYVNSYYGKINDENQAEMLKQRQVFIMMRLPMQDCKISSIV